ncbi:MAG: hypothetical protein EB023_00470 [Flavobacteriia bacterium]|nr:hypothetical protein [Flavobacteriia bacterium]
MLQNNLKASLLLSRNLSFFAFFFVSKQIKSKLAPKSQPFFFCFFFRCQSELYQRAKSKKASLTASF